MTARRLAIVIGLALSVTGQSSADDSVVRNHADVPLLVLVRRDTALYEGPDTAASRSMIQSRLDNPRSWRSLGRDVPLAQRHCLLSVNDLP